MTRKARLWIGGTIILVLFINYAVIGIPLYRRSAVVTEKFRASLSRQAKPQGMFKAAEDEYMFDIFRREKINLYHKILLLNCVAGSLFLVAASWTVFGLFLGKK